MQLDDQVKLIQESFKSAANQKAEFAGIFYVNLFDSYPQLEPLFKGVDIEKQGRKLHAALVLLVENVRQEDELKRILIPLGKKHTAYGALPEHYSMIGENILQTLESFNEGQWTSEHEMAWRNTIDQVTDIMLSASGVTSSVDAHTSGSQKKKTPSSSAWLEPELMDKVEESFTHIKADKQSFTESFYETLFEQSPQLRPLFSGTNVMRQGSKLYATLVLLVENLRHPQELERVLLPLGNKHRGYGATAEHYPMVNAAILTTLERSLGSDWTPDVAKAWARTCDHVQEVMLRGANQGLAGSSNEPPGTSLSMQTDQSPLRSQPDSARSSSGRRQAHLLDRFSNWFYSTSLSTIIAIWALIGLSVITLSYAFPSIRGVVVFANPLSLLLALFLFLRETPERKKQSHYHAWSIIDNAAQVRTSHARFLALQDLSADGVSLRGLPLEGAELGGIKLPEADLSSSNMSECTLSDADLCKSDMNHADLQRANLSGANLSNANLGFANLSGANCASAQMTGANLLFADLRDANLSGANLEGAKISGANLAGTYLGGANLRGTDIREEQLEGAFLVGATLPDGTAAPQVE